ncbi:MAG: aminoglycoside phosphotransferase [Modestobacter sp.]|nr:aminoglycoside phosphotransferase [Modestobacter sp.]MCW2577797.1 aminoglycoside phosphotransferase [Modestobacter sp.]MCW2618745.1 aminoglycoside phosphotransferase [Modestobacter sp.]
MDGLSIDTALVQRLIAGQFPAWASLPIAPVPHSGWDNRTFRLGDEMLARHGLPVPVVGLPVARRSGRRDVVRR